MIPINNIKPKAKHISYSFWILNVFSFNLIYFWTRINFNFSEFFSKLTWSQFRFNTFFTWPRYSNFPTDFRYHFYDEALYLIKISLKKSSSFGNSHREVFLKNCFPSVIKIWKSLTYNVYKVLWKTLMSEIISTKVVVYQPVPLIESFLFILFYFILFFFLKYFACFPEAFIIRNVSECLLSTLTYLNF